jgi:hypothetical protein
MEASISSLRTSVLCRAQAETMQIDDHTHAFESVQFVRCCDARSLVLYFPSCFWRQLLSIVAQTSSNHKEYTKSQTG